MISLTLNLTVFCHIYPSFTSFDPTRLLLTFGASLSKVDKVNGNSALHWACVSGNHVVIKLLLNKGADINALNLKVRSTVRFVMS